LKIKDIAKPVFTQVAPASRISRHSCHGSCH